MLKAEEREGLYQALGLCCIDLSVRVPQGETVNFDLRLIYDGEYVRVTGSISEYRPATGPSMESAGGDPAEGGEIQDFAIFAADGAEIEDADGLICDELADEIYRKAAEAAADDKADAAEARADRERDG